MSEPRVRVGLLGCGAVAHRWYLSGLAQPTEHHVLSAVADIDVSRAASAAHAYGVDRCHASLEDLLDDDGIDLVVILTRHADHPVQVEASLRAGKHVYCEKPLASTPGEAARLANLAASAGLSLAAAPQVMLSARNQVMKDLVGRGAVGDLTLVRVSGSNLGPAERPGVDYDPRWFYQDGGSLQSLGIYALSTLVWMLGVPDVVTSFHCISRPEREVRFGPRTGEAFRATAPDNEIALLRYGAGCLVLFDGSYVVPHPPAHEFEIHGSGGSILVGGYGGPESVLLCPTLGEPECVGPPPEATADWTLAWGVLDQTRAILDGGRPAAGVWIAVDVLETIEMMRESARTGAHVERQGREGKIR